MDDEVTQKPSDGTSESTLDESEMVEVLDADQALQVGAFAEQRAEQTDDGWLSLLAGLRQFYAETGRVPEVVREDTPTRLGKFDVHECIGIGGFGFVYRATDTVLRREVALKVPTARALVSPESQVRFVREARAAAALAHPNIVPVFESGQDGPVNFIAVQFCRGPTLARWLRERTDPVPPHAAARLLVTLAGAVQHAHDQRILHRDLKPANILLESYTTSAADLEDLNRWQPRITDFGLAKLLDEIEEHTHTGEQIGTPPYMAPEQAAGRIREIGPATDVYALGAILYEVLTGRPPFQGETARETRLLVCHEDPVAPRNWRPKLPRDIETICLTCLAKDPKRRYSSAGALRDDLQRFLDGRGIAARPVPRFEHVARWARRRPLQAAVAALLAIVVAGVVAAAFGYVVLLERWNRRIVAALTESDRQRVRAERYYAASEVQRAFRAVKDNRADEAQEILSVLDQSLPALPAGGQSAFARRYLASRLDRQVTQLRGHHDRITTLSVSADGQLLATGTGSGELIVWKLATGQLYCHLTNHAHSAVVIIEFSHDAQRIASSAIDFRTSKREIALWDLGTSKPLARWTIGDCRVETAILNDPNEPPEGNNKSFTGRMASTLGDAESNAQSQFRLDVASPVFDLRDRLWLFVGARFPTRNRIQVWDMHSVPATPRVIGDEAAEDFSIPDWFGAYLTFEHGKVCVAAHDRSVSRLYQSKNEDLGYFNNNIYGQRSQVLATPPRAIRGSHPAGARATRSVVSPDRRWIARADESGALRLVHGPTGRVRELLPPHPEWKLGSPGWASTMSLDFAPDSSALAASVDNQIGAHDSILIWSTEAERPPEVFSRSTSPFGAPIRFLPDSRTLVVGGGHNVRLWHWKSDVDAPSPLSRLTHSSEAWGVAFSPGGTTLATSGDDSKIRLWNPATSTRETEWDAHPDTVAALAYRPDGRVLASVSLGASDNVRLWDPRNQRLLATLRGHSDKVRAVAYSRDGRTLATAGSDRSVRLWDGWDGKLRAVLTGHQEMVKSLAFAPDGAVLASASLDASVRVWNVASGTLAAELALSAGGTALAFSADGRTLAAADEQGSISLWDRGDRRAHRVIAGTDGEVRALAFTPDGGTLAAAGMSGRIHLWEPATGQEMLTLEGPRAQVNGLAFSPDGKTLASVDHTGEVKLWSSRESAGVLVSPDSPK